MGSCQAEVHISTVNWLLPNLVELGYLGERYLASYHAQVRQRVQEWWIHLHLIHVLIVWVMRGCGGSSIDDGESCGKVPGKEKSMRID